MYYNVRCWIVVRFIFKVTFFFCCLLTLKLAWPQLYDYKNIIKLSFFFLPSSKYFIPIRFAKLKNKHNTPTPLVCGIATWMRQWRSSNRDSGSLAICRSHDLNMSKLFTHQPGDWWVIRRNLKWFMGDRECTPLMCRHNRNTCFQLRIFLCHIFKVKCDGVCDRARHDWFFRRAQPLRVHRILRLRRGD